MTDLEDCKHNLNIEELRQILEGVFLRHHHSNADHLELLGENLGYPVLLLVMSAIEFVASIRFRKAKRTDPNPVDEYFHQYMNRVDHRYGRMYESNLRSVSIDADLLLLKESERSYTNIGTILRESMRNRISHSCGSILEIDARNEMRKDHLELRRAQGFTNLFVHAYVLHRDYRRSLSYLYEDLSDSDSLRRSVQANLGREWARIRLSAKAVDEVLAKPDEQIQILPPSLDGLPAGSTLQKLQEISNRFISGLD